MISLTMSKEDWRTGSIPELPLLRKQKFKNRKETKMEKILRGFNGASFNHLLSEEEKEAFEKIIEVLSKTELSVIQINKVLYSVDTELYKVAMNKSLKHLKSNQ